MKEFSPEYIAYMQSEAWNRKRRERLKMDRYTCQDCGAQNVPLDVHHITYERFGGNELMSDLKSLCRPCHELRHDDSPTVVYDICRTCGKMLMIFVRRVWVLGTSWIDYTCQDGHMRSYKDET